MWSNKLKNLLLLFFFIIVVFNTFSLDSRIVIQSGHEGDINSIVYHQKYKYILSAGKDGTVKIWKPDSKELLYNIQLSNLPIEKIVVSPEKSHFAVLIKTSLTSSKIIAYDWMADKTIFTINLNEVPLYFTYSSNGSYFLYLKAEWESIMIFNANTGIKLPYLTDGFGIVSFIVTSNDDKRILAYKPSGKIIIKEIISGKDTLTTPLNTLESLNSINVSSNIRFLSAAWGKELVIIDLQSGKKITSIEQPNIISTTIRSDGKEILCLYKNRDKNQIKKYSFNGTELKEVLFIDNALNANITDYFYLNEKTYFSCSTGELFSATEKGEISLFSKTNLLKVMDIASTKNLMALATLKNIFFINPAIFQESEEKTVNYTFISNPFIESIGINFIDPEKIVVWNNDKNPYKFEILNINSSNILKESEGFSSPLKKVESIEPGLLIFEQNGQCQILDPITYESIFKYTVSGINKLLQSKDNTLIAARNRIGQTGSSLLEINYRTGETVPINSSSLLCYDIAYDKTKKYLYSVNILKENNTTLTLLNLNYGVNLEDNKTIKTYDGEDLSSSIILDSDNQYLYSSIGFEGIQIYEGLNLKKITKSNVIPRKLYLYDNMLFSLNKNSTLSIWNRFSGLKIMDIYLLNTDEIDWIALFANGNYTTSKNGINYLKQY